MRSTGRVLRIARLFALAIALCCLASGAAFAGVNNISRVVGTTFPLVDNSGLSYNVNLVLDSDNKASLPLRIDGSGAGDGTKIDIEINALTGATGSATASPASPLTIGASGQASTTVNFADVTDLNSKFVITITLWDDSNKKVATSGTASVTVSFSTPVALTGVALDHSTLSIRPETTDQYLNAKPTPEKATNVTYSWHSSDSGKVVVTPDGSTAQITVGASAKPGDKATVTVTATGHSSSTATATCEITVLDEKSLADDMKVPTKDSGGSDLYGVDDRFIIATIGTDGDTKADIEKKIADGTPLDDSHTGKIVYVSDITAVSPDKFDFRTAPSVIVSRLALEENDELRGRYVTGMLISADVSESYKSGTGDIAMVPLRAAFKFPNDMKYPNGNEITPQPSDAKNFMDNYRIMKYFGSGRSNVVDLSSLMSGTSYIDERDQRTQAFPLKPLIVLVNAAAPTGRSDVVHASNNKYGAKFDKNNNILYIYDGDFDASATDPIVLERRPQSSGGGGGGGGGCEALGLTAVALFAFAALGLATNRKDR